MKKLLFFLIPVSLFLLNILIKGLFIQFAPNSISLKEISLLNQLGWTYPINDLSFRFISVFVSSCIATGSYLFIYNKTKNYLLGSIICLVLTFTPWIFILSRYLNIYLPIILGIILIYLVFKNKYPAILSGVFLTCYVFFHINHELFSQFKDITRLSDSLFSMLDLRLLFFNGDPVSYMFNTPMTGFFLFIDVIALFGGLYAVYLQKNPVRNFITWILILGIVFFTITSPDELLSLKGIVLFYGISLIIGSGYYFLFVNLNKKNKLFTVLFMIIIVSNLIFYQELFISHFDKHNSFEWGYAETKASEYIISHPSKTIYLTDESNKINRFLQYFTKKSATIITLNNAKIECFQSNTSCIVREHELAFFKLEKDQIKTKFSNFDGLPVYFLLNR